ncbi:sensor histidine kinase [Sulfurovum sp. NBC37-1]|uniref:sensor histidine kinase n=1 Tax=Sulfurovum sp. (strain NBC37-1) TaxID=387093 RepID=UPI0001587712|nr:HAMP domain-containing sensor histidine kinase [Sulfurovum sp. NBC37-1]BAF71587.1 conserved hypothetical protein [Sulfurovum sp. NBC37-1]
MKNVELQEAYFSSQKTRLLLRVLAILAITIAVMLLVRLSEGDYNQFVADILFEGIVVFGYVRLKKDASAYKVITRIVFFSAIFVSFFLLRNHPDMPIRFIWFSTIVYMIYYLFDKREAYYWISMLTVVLLILYFSDMQSFSLSVIDFFIWILNMVIVLMISHWYATIEEASTKKLLYIQHRLAEEVSKKTWELERRTKELEALNQNLEDRVGEAVRKNSEQEQLLFIQARHAQMGEALSMIAHQWRQPLNAIALTNVGMQKVLRSAHCDIEQFTAKTKRIEEYVQHLSQTIDDFRNFFRFDSEKSDFVLSKTVDDALDLIGSGLKAEGITVTIEEICHCIVYSYPNEVIHVILNLLNNARDALTAKNIDDKHIIIRMYRDRKSVYLEIEDSGGGIPEVLIEKVFDPYFTTKEESGGTGLGLYMSKLIVEKHCQGRLEVKNTDKGACFRVCFPLESE